MDASSGTVAHTSSGIWAPISTMMSQMGRFCTVCIPELSHFGSTASGVGWCCDVGTFCRLVVISLAPTALHIVAFGRIVTRCNTVCCALLAWPLLVHSLPCLMHHSKY